MVENGKKISSMKENLLGNGLLSKIVSLVLKEIDPDIPPPSTASQGANTDRVSHVGVGIDQSPTLHTSVAVYKP